jgi:ATP-dependent DNA helicase RecQ
VGDLLYTAIAVAPPSPRNLELFGSDARERGLEVAAEVAALAASWKAGDQANAFLRRSCEVRLEALRALWRKERHLFGEEELERLRQVADGLRRPPSRPGAPATADAAAVAGGGAPGAGLTHLQVLREVFGYESFRPGQQAIIEAALAGRDCLGVMPTGAGKSITYQIPARILGGTTLVVSPLIALMKDQVDAMARVGIRATFLNSSLDPDERRERVRRVRRGELELVYAAPEGLEASVGSALEGVKLSALAVDEAHCISHWGHDFRPAYRNLRGLKARFSGIPVLALTATATPEVARDIAEQLGMEEPLIHLGSFFRPNLKLHAYKKGDGQGGAGASGLRTRDAILRLVRSRPGQSGIVYCLSRKSVEATAELLRDHGVRATAYHAGMETEARTAAQDAFQSGEIDVVVATVAFGMGIDKPDIRYVIHRDMPRSIEGYYQEIGRAGRDGQPSDCILFYSWVDVIGWDRMCEDAEDPAIAEVQRGQARQMFRLAADAPCRHQALVRHFGERIPACGGSCDLCTQSDLVAEARPVRGERSRVRRAKGQPEEAAPEREGSMRGPASGRPSHPDTDYDEDLFQALRALRRQLAAERSVPPYIVFADAVLRALAAERPQDEDALSRIPGIGPKKLEQYGEAFLAVLRKA